VIFSANILQKSSRNKMSKTDNHYYYHELVKKINFLAAFLFIFKIMLKNLLFHRLED